MQVVGGYQKSKQEGPNCLGREERVFGYVRIDTSY
jgi:hypothetical protein